MAISNKVEFGFAESPFGSIIVARTWDGVCDLQFLDYNRLETIHELAMRWGEYTPTTQSDTMAQTVEQVIFEGLDHPVPLDVKGTEFQLKVWNELRKIPFGTTVSYQRWPNVSVSRRPCAPSPQPSPRIRWRCSSPATASSMLMAPSESTTGAET